MYELKPYLLMATGIASVIGGLNSVLLLVSGGVLMFCAYQILLLRRRHRVPVRR